MPEASQTRCPERLRTVLRIIDAVSGKGPDQPSAFDMPLIGAYLAWASGNSTDAPDPIVLYALEQKFDGPLVLDQSLPLGLNISGDGKVFRATQMNHLHVGWLESFAEWIDLPYYKGSPLIGPQHRAWGKNCLSKLRNRFSSPVVEKQAQLIRQACSNGSDEAIKAALSGANMGKAALDTGASDEIVELAVDTIKAIHVCSLRGNQKWQFYGLEPDLPQRMSSLHPLWQAPSGQISTSVQRTIDKLLAGSAKGPIAQEVGLGPLLVEEVCTSQSREHFQLLCNLCADVRQSKQAHLEADSDPLLTVDEIIAVELAIPNLDDDYEIEVLSSEKTSIALTGITVTNQADIIKYSMEIENSEQNFSEQLYYHKFDPKEYRRNSIAGLEPWKKLPLPSRGTLHEVLRIAREIEQLITGRTVKTPKRIELSTSLLPDGEWSFRQNDRPDEHIYVGTDDQISYVSAPRIGIRHDRVGFAQLMSHIDALRDARVKAGNDKSKNYAVKHWPKEYIVDNTLDPGRNKWCSNMLGGIKACMACGCNVYENRESNDWQEWVFESDLHDHWDPITGAILGRLCADCMHSAHQGEEYWLDWFTGESGLRLTEDPDTEPLIYRGQSMCFGKSLYLCQSYDPSVDRAERLRRLTLLQERTWAARKEHGLDVELSTRPNFEIGIYSVYPGDDCYSIIPRRRQRNQA